jgi:hypothetical protein
MFKCLFADEEMNTRRRSNVSVSANRQSAGKRIANAKIV